ncbi:MAG: DUF4249 domain-containing protein [Flavobacteriaceae bacterium]|nr:DUF4249 domain-containing protein [Flavobacteriaceae bacterium]
MKKFDRAYYFLIIVLLIVSCTEPFTIQNIEETEALVVEASITNEVSYQSIYLSKAINLTEDKLKPEVNAIVYIKGDNNTVYNFKETTSGVYVSTNTFSAQKNVNYQLFIELANGKKYESLKEKTTSNSQFNDIKVKLHENLDGDQEFRLFVDSSDLTGNSKYYRYTYEETYKIVAPFWSPYELQSDKNSSTGYKIVRKTDLTKGVCYSTNVSNTIIQTETTSLEKDNVLFPIRRISVDDFIISHRYSILVKQYVQSFEAYTYYKVLSKFSNASNLLSQSQPGFFNGNIFSTTDKEERIIGFFEVVSVNSKRIFFNYRDFFKTGRPDYIEKCGLYSPSAKKDPNFGLISPLEDALENGWVYFSETGFDTKEIGPYNLVAKECGDCTKSGTNIKPSFWID